MAHFAEYVDYPNHHLKRTFTRQNVRGKDCTRLEISFLVLIHRMMRDILLNEFKLV